MPMVPEARAGGGPRDRAREARDRRGLRRGGAASDARAPRLGRAVRHHDAEPGRRDRGGGRRPAGDARRRQQPAHAVLAGIERAKMLVVPDDDPATAHRIAPSRAAQSDDAHRRAHALSRRDRRARRKRARIRWSPRSSRASCRCSPRCCATTMASRRSRSTRTAVRGGGYAALRDEGVPETPVVVCNIPGGCAPDGTPLAPASRRRESRREP